MIQCCKMYSIILFLMLAYYPTTLNARHIPEGYYHSDVIITKWPTTSPEKNLSNIENAGQTAEVQRFEERKPGWMRQQLIKFGEVASKIGNAMGKHTSKIAVALDKVCEVVKTVIPLLAAVCHVGEFGFCAATDDTPVKLSEAMNIDTLDLNLLDR